MGLPFLRSYLKAPSTADEHDAHVIPNTRSCTPYQSWASGALIPYLGHQWNSKQCTSHSKVKTIGH